MSLATFCSPLSEKDIKLAIWEDLNYNYTTNTRKDFFSEKYVKGPEYQNRYFL